MFHKEMSEAQRFVYVKGLYINTQKKFKASTANLIKFHFFFFFLLVLLCVFFIFFFFFFFNMGGIQKQMFGEPCFVAVRQEFHDKLEDHWASVAAVSSTSSFEESSVSSVGSVSSLDLADDASSSASNSSFQSNGPLEDFTELLAQLPIKRGLSMFYQGKSQSFTSLSSVKSIEDLPKKETPYSRRLNGCKSYAGGLDIHKSSYTLPKAPSFKKASRSSLSFVQIRRGSSTLAGSRPPSIHVYDESF